MAIIYAGNDLLSRHTLASSARELRTWTSAPYPPSPPQRDQHTVVHGYDAAVRLCAVLGILCTGRSRTV